MRQLRVRLASVLDVAERAGEDRERLAGQQKSQQEAGFEEQDDPDAHHAVGGEEVSCTEHGCSLADPRYIS